MKTKPQAKLLTATASTHEIRIVRNAQLCAKCTASVPFDIVSATSMYFALSSNSGKVCALAFRFCSISQIICFAMNQAAFKR